MLARPHRPRRQLVRADVSEVPVRLAWRQVCVRHAHLGQLLMQMALDLEKVHLGLLAGPCQEVAADVRDGDVLVDRRL